MVDLSKRALLRSRTSPSFSHQLPWLTSQQSLHNDCTQCGQCISACETQIIIKGDGGFPTVDFRNGECVFCYRCAMACDEPLFRPQHEAPWENKAKINERCLAKNNIECRSCSDMCEPMAIQFKPELGRVAQPILSLEQCNGCGACVASCPSNAITVSN